MTEMDKKVLEAIERRQLSPRPYAYFLAKRSVLWTLAVLSILLGAISVALIIFAIGDMRTTGGRGLDEMPLDDVLVNLPYVWLASLGLFVASALYSIRQTRRGYRYRTLHVVGAAILASSVLGMVLHFADAGAQADRILRAHIPLYDRLTRSSETRKNDPAGGFLAGKVLQTGGDKSLTLLDFDNHTWTVEFDGAAIAHPELIGTGEDIAIEGVQTGPARFRARSIRDWD